MSPGEPKGGNFSLATGRVYLVVLFVAAFLSKNDANNSCRDFAADISGDHRLA